MSDYIAKNRADWNATSREYQSQHGAQLDSKGLAWGVWSLPEQELGALGPVRGRSMLELGCGACQWSVRLAQRGARPIGLDLSEQQLAHARAAITAAGVRIPLVHANAEDTPFRDASFDTVFCDHGAMSFADPYRTVPEAARILRPGGRFVFNITSPLYEWFYDDAVDQPSDAPKRSYFTMHRIESADEVCFQLPYGEWIRLFRRHGLVLDDLIELRPPRDARSSYTGYDSIERARAWPVENIWKLRRLS